MVFADKIKAFFSGRRSLTDEAIDDLADLLVEGDFGAQEAFRTAELLRERCRKEGCADIEGAKRTLAAILRQTLLKAGGAKILPETPPGALSVILLLGVNGAGKTTAAAKLGRRYAAFHPVLAAADTFRAGAVDQLKRHGERLNERVVAHKDGGDPAAVVFDAIQAARAHGSLLVIADTAGRMHTKKALVEELKKIDRIVQYADNGIGTDYLKYLVLDATTGRNAVAQAETFSEAVNLDGVILTKTDSTAKGGVVFSLAEKFALPVAFLGSGERYEDLSVFDGDRFIDHFLGA
jgi:fused signal recognition particle receptor